MPATSNNLRCQASQFPDMQIFEYQRAGAAHDSIFRRLNELFYTDPSRVAISRHGSSTRRDKGRPTFQGSGIKTERSS